MSTETLLFLIFGGMESLATAACAYFAWRAMNKKTDVVVKNHPLAVEIVEELHQRFASRQDFVDHVKDNDHQRGVLHKRMDEAIADYNDKFQALPNQIVALLRNTGNLK